jgi:hypothetical protein
MCDSNSNCSSYPMPTSVYAFDAPPLNPEKEIIRNNIYALVNLLPDGADRLYYSNSFANNYAFPVPHPNPESINRECWTKNIAYGIVSRMYLTDYSTECNHIIIPEEDRERITQTVWYQASAIMDYLINGNPEI